MATIGVHLVLYMWTHPLDMHPHTCKDQLDEKDVAEKLSTLRTHESTIQFTLDNFSITLTRLNALLGKGK